jgi:dipeptidyl aminopeptidase/acylaminoacyl peptidase
MAAASPQDLLKLRDLSELRLSPDGGMLLFRVQGKLMRMAAAGGQAAEVPGAPEGASNLSWSPDGKRVALLSGKALWVFEVASNRFIRICDYDRGNSYISRAGSSLAWSPDGARIAFAGTLEPAPPPGDPLVFTRILYKTRTALSDNRRSHIFVVPSSGGAPRAVTAGDHDEHSISWGAGPEIVFLSNREPDPDANLNYDIYAVDPDRGAERQITRTPGVEMEPALSPDGKRVAYIATRRSRTTIDSVAEDTHVWTTPVEGGAGMELNAALDRRSTAPAWIGEDVVYLAQDRGRTLLYRAGKPLFQADAQVSGWTAGGSAIAFLMSSPASPPEVYLLQDGTPARLTEINAGVIPDPIQPEAVRYRSFDGTPIEGWLYMPPGNGRAPMILSIHGGPHGMSGYAFNARNTIHASRGYATLLLNPRGSAGYGQKFADGCINDWGGGDYRDLMAGVDHVLKKYPRLDPQRLVVTGSSYGGYMTNWIVTQTDRFRAAVAGASISNLISFYATSLYQDLIEAEFDGHPWAAGHYERLWQRSPLKHVASARTPVLFLHGERDNDVHITQAEEMYTALRRRGIEAMLARYPREGHGFREPKHTVDALERTLDWFDRFTRKPAAAK